MGLWAWGFGRMGRYGAMAIRFPVAMSDCLFGGTLDSTMARRAGYLE